MDILLATGAVGEQTSNGTEVHVLNVCELLGNLGRYSGAAIAVVGRLESSVSFIDQHDFVVQDQCPQNVVTNGHTWSNKMLIWTSREEGMPPSPMDKPKLHRAAVAAKLARNSALTTNQAWTHEDALQR